MFPVYFSDNQADAFAGHSVFPTEFSERNACSGFCANIYDLFGGHFCLIVFLASGHSSFSGCVLLIVAFSSKKQMVWVDALRVIAMMAKVHTVCYDASVEHPCRMSSPKVMALGWERSDHPVTVLVLIARPFPATIFASCVLIKSFVQRHFPVAAFTAAIRLWASAGILSDGVKLSATA